MWLEESNRFKHLKIEAVKIAQDQLQYELGELKKEIEINELVHGIAFARPFTSTPVPSDAQQLALERKFYVERLLQVHDVRKPYIQADVMREEANAASKTEYSMESLPIILQQFYADRIRWCIQAKHSHLLRWKRFSEHTQAIEDMYIDFKNRSAYILSEYNDALKRAQRLNIARESLLASNSCAQAVPYLQTDDIEIYLRWLICHFYSQKHFMHSMKTLEWLPYQISVELFTLTDPALSSRSSSLNLLSTGPGQASSQQYLVESSNYKYIKPTTETNVAKNPYSLLNILTSRFKLLENVYLPNTTAVVPREETFNSLSYMFNKDEMPIHNNSLEFLLPRLRYLTTYYKIDYDLARMQTSGDEMELFAAVNRKFRHLFAQQEHMQSFKIYDGDLAEHWGLDSPIHALKKEANWIEFVRLIPEKDIIYEKLSAKIKQRKSMDEYLKEHNAFCELSDDERVQEAYKENAAIIKNPPNIEATSVTTHHTSFNSNSLWKKIFNNSPAAYEKESNKISNDLIDETNSSAVAKPISFRSKTVKRMDDFNFVENLQKLGLDDSKTNEQNLTNVQGSYLSFLLLRHLRIRDLKRQALGVLNYFRSIERTVTIYDGGLSLEGKHFKRQNAQDHSKETAYGGNLGYHAYMFNRVSEFKVNEAEFMEFAEIENHDDFYSIDEKEFIHIQDQRGFYIMYDAALEDFKRLEMELMSISSYYIAKNKEMLDVNEKIKEKEANNGRRRSTLVNQQDTDVNLKNYSHQLVDRFAVLLDIWTNEVNFLEMKRNLFDIYYEVYQNTFDKTEKRNIAQILTDIMHRRVRFDLEANYFTSSYRFEVSCLYKQTRIVKILLDKMIDEMRNLMEKIDDDKHMFGLPYRIIKKNLINLTPSASKGHSLKNFYMLEYHPCLASASRIPGALKQAIEELMYFKTPESVNERLAIEQYFYNNFIEHLERGDPPGHTFNPQFQKEILNANFVEDPIVMSDFLYYTLKQIEEQSKTKTKREQNEMALSASARILEMTTLRFRILNSAFSAECLSNMYRKMATLFGFEDFHMFLRYVQFDFAKFKENAGQPFALFVNEINPEEIQVDRFTSNTLSLAVNEIEESQIGKFSFKTKDGVQQLIKQTGIENLQLVLKLQIVHNNAISASVMQSHACLLTSNLAPIVSKTAKSDADSSNVSEFKKTSLKPISDTSSTSNLNTKVSAGNAIQHSSNKIKQFSDSFVSLQLEKNPFRDLMLNEFIKQKESKGLMLSNPAEMEKLKRNLMNVFADQFGQRVEQFSLRSQLIQLYYSVTKILENFPNTRDNHFFFGAPYEKRDQMALATAKALELAGGIGGGDGSDKPIETDETVDHLMPDPRMFKKRPRKLLSDDGQRVLNLWFIPHFTDILSLYRKKHSNESATKALRHSVRIIGAFNDILHFMYANACLNVAVNSSASTDLSTTRRKIDFTSWENSGGLDTELNEIQLEMNQLNDPCDPEQVIQLLEMKRSSMLLQFDCAIRFAVREIFLAHGNDAAYKTVNDNMHFGLRFLNDYAIDTCENTYLSLPEVFESRDELANQIMPWRSFLSRNGAYPLKYWAYYMMEPYISLCLTGLKDIDKNIANGEILGVTILMEDLLNSKNNADLEDDDDDEETQTEVKPDKQKEANSGKAKEPSKEQQSNEEDSANKQVVVNTAATPVLINNYKRWRNFLLIWKRLEILKLDWGRRKLGVEEINSSERYSTYSENYKKDILVPVLKILVKNSENKDNRDYYNNIVDFKQPILLPQDVSEIQSKMKQITRLLEKLETYMINETIQRLQKELKLVLAERARDENTLTNDLWRKAIMKEEFTINKPHIANDFTKSFFTYATANGPEDKPDDVTYTIKGVHLRNCLIHLGTAVQEREKSNFEQYTMFYENLLRQQHQLMYKKEREILTLRNLVETKIDEVNIEVQCQMADTCYDLIMEVTALRAKLTEMADEREVLEKSLREKVKGEFIDLVTDLLNVNTNLRSQLDHFKELIYSHALELLATSRREAIEKIASLKDKYKVEIDKFAEASQAKHDLMLNVAQRERHELAKILIKQKSYDKIRINRLMSHFSKKLTEVTENSNKIKRQEIDNTLLFEQKQLLINQQKSALKKRLVKLDVDFNHLKAQLEKELKEKQNKEHELQQRLKNEKNLHLAKQSNVEKLFEELESKEIELRNLHLITEKAAKIQMMNENKIQREITMLKKTMIKEQNLKLDAFQRVDELQTNVYNLEDDVKILMSRPQTTKSNRFGINKYTPLQRANSSFNFQADTKQSPVGTFRPKSSILKISSRNDAQEFAEGMKDQNTLIETISELREVRANKSTNK